jgi:hypothetical protein
MNASTLPSTVPRPEIPQRSGRDWLRLAFGIGIVGAILFILAFVAAIAAMVGLALAVVWLFIRLLRRPASEGGEPPVLDARKTPDGWVAER